MQSVVKVYKVDRSHLKESQKEQFAMQKYKEFIKRRKEAGVSALDDGKDNSDSDSSSISGSVSSGEDVD